MAEGRGELEIPLLAGDGETTPPDTTPTQPGPGPITDPAIASTLHRCHSDLREKLNFHLLYPCLNEAAIVPVEAMSNLMRLLPPHNTSTQIDNLILWLRQCTPEQFSGFIRLVKSTSDAAGDAHDELAKSLEEAYKEFKTEGVDTPTTAIWSPEFRGGGGGGGFSVHREPAPRPFRCDGCREKWKDWKCKYWCPAHLTCWLFLIAISLFFFPFFTNYPGILYSEITPTHLASNFIIEMRPGSNPLGWFLMFNLNVVNCTGNVLVFQDTNCSVLDPAKVCSGERFRYNGWLGKTPLYFLEDSYLTVDYSDENSTRSFIILKSNLAREKYLELCKEFNNTNERGSCINTKTIDRLCADNSTDDPADSYLRANMWCFVNVQGRLSRFDINQSDFYYIAYNASISAASVPAIRGSVCAYEHSVIAALENQEIYDISKSSDSISFASFPLSKFLSFDTDNSCRVFRPKCNDSRTLHELEYSLERRVDILIFPSIPVFLCLCVALGLMCTHTGHICVRNRRLHREQES